MKQFSFLNKYKDKNKGIEGEHMGGGGDDIKGMFDIFPKCVEVCKNGGLNECKTGRR